METHPVKLDYVARAASVHLFDNIHLWPSRLSREQIGWYLLRRAHAVAPGYGHDCDSSHLSCVPLRIEPTNLHLLQPRHTIVVKRPGHSAIPVARYRWLESGVRYRH